VGLDALILADAVSTPPDDKFYIHGGGFSRYEVPALPFPVPLGVLIRLKVEASDLHKSHHFRVAFIGPTGLPNVPPVEFVGNPPTETAELVEGEERFVNIALQIGAVAVRDGLYHLELHIDGHLARRVPLPVVVTGGQAQATSGHEWPQAGEPAQTSRPNSAAVEQSKAKRPPSPPKGA